MGIGLAVAMWKKREGCKLVLYYDTKGVPTLAWGHNCRVPISQAAADLILSDDHTAIAQEVAAIVGIERWGQIGEVRQAALIDMGTMGPAKLAGFKDMLGAIDADDWDKAAKEALNSQWRRDVGMGRAGEVADMLRTGQPPAWWNA